LLDQLLPLLRIVQRSIGLMARVSAPITAATELYLIQGEVPDTQDLDDARQWVTIYRELVTFADRTLSRLRREIGGSLDGEGLNTSDADERGMEGHLRRLHSRLDFWERRLWELAGLDLDVRRRVLSYAGQRLTLTRREAELLAFLARRPGQFFAAAQLVNLAWGAPELSAEQLRTYVVRLRRHLATTGVPARLVSEPRRGYGLVFTA
jgi:Transcriptional regulatory protein, C terminal